MKKDIFDKIKVLPDRSGVYIFKDVEGGVIYVGKAKSLKKRVRSYFSNCSGLPVKIKALVSNIADLEYIETGSEAEALILEMSLVSEYMPKYNTKLKDDKKYPLLKITSDKYPRLEIVRMKDDYDADYFGPYTETALLREAVKFLNGIFKIRKCKNMKKKPCLYYHIGGCLAPCAGDGVYDEYLKEVDRLKNFLKGGRKNLIEYLSSLMDNAAAEYRYEEAKRYAEQIKIVKRIKNKRYSENINIISYLASYELKDVLKLKRVPKRIFCFDISNFSGYFAVASRVSFFKEVPEKNMYRRYKIKGVSGIDDYAMMREVLIRMSKSLIKDKKSNWPDIVLIDGGLGHLNVAGKVFSDFGITKITLLSIAKKFEIVYGLSGKLKLEENGPVHNLLRRVRDEAHRFAVSYHRLLRNASNLGNIE